VQSDGAYIISGGAGAIGSVYANYLADSGARTIILIGRTPPNESLTLKIQEFKERGIALDFIRADVSDRQSIEKAMDVIKKEYPPIKGIVHAAGALSDKILWEQDWDSYETVLNPKIGGAIHLYESIEKSELDFFIMLSSITAVICNAGQSNYTAANYFLNRLAAQMSLDSVPGFVQCWGPWLEGGMASGKTSVSQNLANLGIQMFTKEQAITAIKDFFSRPVEQFVFANVDWKTFAETTGRENSLFLSNLYDKKAPEEKHEKSQENHSWVEQLAGMEEDVKRTTLLKKIQILCGKIMGFESEALPQIDIPLKEQGVDSLMMFSIRSEINQLLNINMAISAIFNYPTITKLTNYIIDETLFPNYV
jgi:NADP-dependent 3-hydroxy acid dehydrogenase YdfG/acyl carrier protein